MRYFTLLLAFVFVGFSCSKQSNISKDFNCNTSTYDNLETLNDFKKNFSIQLPKNWKTNYYYDDVVSSIYSADTTLSLTQATLIDASYILNPIAIDAKFINKVKSDNQKMQLQEVTSKKTTFLGKPSYYNLSIGEKGKYDYQILNIFTKTNMGFLHVKTEIYGDSLVNERICKAVNLINKIKVDEL